MAFWLGSASAQEADVGSAGETTRPAATAGGVVTSDLGLAIAMRNAVSAGLPPAKPDCSVRSAHSLSFGEWR
jgi:hypothetical protein